MNESAGAQGIWSHSKQRLWAAVTPLSVERRRTNPAQH